MRQQVEVSADQSGRLQTDIEISKVLLRYLADLYGAPQPVLQEIALFDPAEIMRSLTEDLALQAPSVTIVAPQRLRISTEFDRIEHLLAEHNVDMVRITTDETTRTIILTLTPQNVRHAIGLGLFGDSLIVDALLPPAGGMSEAEYIDYLSWALEEYSNREQLEALLRAAHAEITLIPPGEIVAQSGGVVTGNRALFRIALLPILTSTEPRVYSLRYRVSR